MGAIEDFENEKDERVSRLGKDSEFLKLSKVWLEKSMRKKYVYNFSCLGRPIIQFPQDMIAMQEIIWNVKPDLIIETGIAHGGSLIMSASMLELNALTGVSTDARVLGIDIDIREHNHHAIIEHPLSKRIDMIEGSSIDLNVIRKVNEYAQKRNKILVVLDSNHSRGHVLAELRAYAHLVSVDSYCIVYDTFVEDLPNDVFPDREWGPGNSPKTAVTEYLKDHPEFEIDYSIQNKLLITAAPDGYLKRTG